MKKFGIVLSLIFAFLLSIGVGYSPMVFAEEETKPITKISSASQFNEITGNGHYQLDANISFETTKLVPIQNFSGILDGNGYKLIDISFTENIVTPPDQGDDNNDDSTGGENGGGSTGGENDGQLAPQSQGESGVNTTEAYAIFLNTNGAIIKDLTVENFNVSITQSVETESLKVATLVANAEQNTIIENCSVISTNSIEITAKSRTYVGGLVANAKSGTQIKNCKVQQNIKVENSSTTKSNFVGGLVGYSEDSKISFIIQDSTIIANKILCNNSYIGGLVGYATGSYTQIKNAVLCDTIEKEDCAPNVQVGTIIGCIPYGVNMPGNTSIAYIYTTQEDLFIGNTRELQEYKSNSLIDFDVDNKTFGNQTKDMLSSKSFYLAEANNFDQDENWNFVSVWQIEQEKLTLPSLQRFSTFNYTINIDNSFAASGLTKPVLPLESDIITATFNQDKLYDYGQTIEVGGYVTSENNLDKFFKISGIRRDGKVLFKNQTVLDIIQNESTLVEDRDDGSVVYTLTKDKVVIQRPATIKDSTAIKYTLQGSNIDWYVYSSSGNAENLNANTYMINNCNLSDCGDYDFILEAINYKITISTDNASQGTVKRSGAVFSTDTLDDEIKYGDIRKYTAITTTSDFGFNSWYNADKSVELSKTATTEIRFNEQLFADGGMFAGLRPDSELVLIATFTKRVCDITIKFAINNTIIDDLLTTVTIDGENPEKDGVLFKKLPMEKSYYIEAVLPAGYEFVNWYTSDGQMNLGSVGDSLGIDLQITAEDESLVLVANFKEVEKEQDQGNPIIWVIVGVVGVLAIVGVTIFLIVRKKKDSSYKNMY